MEDTEIIKSKLEGDKITQLKMIATKFKLQMRKSQLTKNWRGQILTTQN
jgi:hypothetical protein